MNLRSQIQRIALRWPAYGYRRVHAELLRQGWTVNHKCMLRWMRADNLLCLRRRKFILTTDSKHRLPVYPNLAGFMVVTDIDQLWVADITYIRLQVEFAYLAVLLDAFSRRCIGWALQRSLEGSLVLEALRMALRQPRPRPGLVHHSDRGAICFARLHGTTGTTRHSHQHEPGGNAIRQCPSRKLHQDSQI
jgi:putative transposase